MKHLTSVLLCMLMAISLSAQDPWKLSTDCQDSYTGITLANGYIGMVTSPVPFHAKRVHINGLYDVLKGYDAVNSGVEGPKATDITVTLDGQEVKDVAEWSQTLDMKRASMTTRFKSCGASFVCTEYVLRDMPYCLMNVVEITPDRDIDLKVENIVPDARKSRNPIRNYQDVSEDELFIPMNNWAALTRSGRYEIASTTTFIVDDNEVQKSVAMEGDGDNPGMTFSTRLTGGRTFRFAVLAAICNSRDFGTPRNETMRIVQVCQTRGIDALVDTHCREWGRIWKSDIIIEGDPQSQQDVRSALYHLYSFIGEDNRESPSPMGLSGNGYERHIFWDSEIWMYPPMLMLNQDMAKSMMDYRFDRLPQARKRARMFGYKGAMFPWESDDTGEEACPVWAMTGSTEHHITADIAIAAWNYWCVTADREWLAGCGWPLIREAAEFLVSRVTANPDGSYSILHVTGADEYSGPVDDNAFTNGAAKKALQAASAAAKVLRIKPDPQWEKIADGLRFNWFEDGVMMEYAGYDHLPIKQADVNLLAYPLGLMTSKDEIRKNLIYYEDKIDPRGPAMGNCILSAIYAQIGDNDNAYRLFKKCYEPHKCAPFGVLSETAGGHDPYFATGAGGMLQAVLSGFGGLRITPKGIRQVNPCLPKEWTSLTITGVGPEKKTFTIKQ